MSHTHNGKRAGLESPHQFFFSFVVIFEWLSVSWEQMRLNFKMKRFFFREKLGMEINWNSQTHKKNQWSVAIDFDVGIRLPIETMREDLRNILDANDLGNSRFIYFSRLCNMQLSICTFFLYLFSFKNQFGPNITGCKMRMYAKTKDNFCWTLKWDLSWMRKQ